LRSAWLGVPFLAVLIIDVFLPIPGRGAVIALWLLLLLTILLIVFVRLRLRQNSPALQEP
jgi:hypothetical protein